MAQFSKYLVRLALLVTASILGSLALLKLLVGIYSEDLASNMVACIVALALFLNGRGTVELFLNKSHDFLIAVTVRPPLLTSMRTMPLAALTNFGAVFTESWFANGQNIEA